MSSYRRLLPIAASAAVLLAACSGAAGSPSGSPDATADGGVAPSGSPSAAPSGSSDGGERFVYDTDPTHVVLRLDEGGGFVMPEFTATNTPAFTLYGDGTVIFRSANAVEAPRAEGEPTIHPPLRMAKLSEDQIQALLEFAVVEGGLGIAREKYANDMVADAATTWFTVDVEGLSKRVEVYALGLDIEEGPDSAAKAAFAKLAERLRDFDQGGSIASDEYQPERFRGMLWEAGIAPGARPWPWAELTPADFVAPQDPQSFSFPSRVMTADEVAALGIGEAKSSVSGIALTAPDGKLYSFALRPLLPDEEA